MHLFRADKRGGAMIHGPQSWTVMLTHQDKYGRKVSTGGGKLNFTILP